MKKVLAAVLDFIGEALGHPKVKRAAWAAAGLLTLDFLVLAFVWYPAAQVHFGLQREISRYHQAREDASRAEESAEIYANLEKRVKVLDVKWNYSVTQSDLIGSLGSLASKNRLKIVSQDFDAVSPQSGGNLFKQNLSLDGSYPALRHFLADLEALPTLTVVKQARLERAGVEGSQVRANLELATYSQSSAEPGS
ncbi:MAG TPA: GspMb/PilO family protein [bacterium]|nr:GspMb/PilO family protein [bacterium]